MTRLRALAVVAVLLALPLAAAAQEAAPQLQEDPRLAKFRDVERGFFLGFEAGFLGFTKTPTAEPANFAYAGKDGGASGGLQVGLTAGYDLTSRLAVAVFAQGGNQKAGPSYGAFSLFAGGLDLRAAVYGARDRNDWERFFFYVHARGGYSKSFPEGLFGTTQLVVQGGPGVEYYTRLRHFSLGLAADGVYATGAKAFGFAVYPTVRYTF